MQTDTIKEAIRTLSIPIENSKTPCSSSPKQKHQAIYKLFGILTADGLEDACKNKIWMHSHDINELFGSENYRQHYLRIANHVYKVGLRDILPGAICMSPADKKEIHDAKCNPQNGLESIVVSSFFLTNQHQSVKTVLLTIEFINSNEQKDYDYHKLQNLCKKKMVGNLVNLGQTFRLNSRSIGVTARVKVFAEQNVETFSLPFGLITKETTINFENATPNKISIINKLKDDILENCKIAVRKKDAMIHEESCIIEYDYLYDVVYNKLKSKLIYNEFRTDIYYDNGKLELFVSNLESLKVKTAFPGCKAGMFLSYQTNLEFVTYGNKLIIAKNDFRVAMECSFKITHVTNAPKKAESSHSLTPWINIDELKEELLRKREFVIGQYLKINLSTGKFIVQLSDTKIYPNDSKLAEDKDSSIRSKWFLNSETEFIFDTEIAINFLRNEIPIKITNVTFEISYSVDGYTFLINEGGNVAELLEEDLKEAIVKEITYSIVEGQMVDIMISGQIYTIKATKCVFPDQSAEMSSHCLGLISPDTVCNFVSCEESQISIIPKKGELHPEKLIETLKELGLGGLEKQLKELIRRVVNFHNEKSKKIAESYGLKPAKGLIFYGPPGTGKTTLARNFSKFLGCAPERINLVSSPDLFKSLSGQSEEKIADLFEGARIAQEKWGSKSPLYVIVLDEFDAVASKRIDSANSWTNSIVNQLLAKMDGLTVLNNILVIAITNRIDSLDEAILRPGRFEVQLEIGLPDEPGRLEIFEIYTKDIIKNNLLAKDVNLKLLAKNTKGFSGADIEGLVRAAISYPIDRLLLADNLGSDAKEALLKVAQSDFNNALEEVSKRKIVEPKAYKSMYG